MSKELPSQLADRLFSTFVAPLVLGGEMNLGRPIGFRRAFTMSVDHRPSDTPAWTNVGIARVRVARVLSPVDSLAEIGPAEWALLAALHDIVQSTHPQLATRFGGRRARALVALSAKTLEHVPDVAHTGEALMRHTLFSRMLQIARTKTKVSWWTGSATFIGTEPPGRLTAWPEARRVQIDKDPQRLERISEMGTLHRTLMEGALQLLLKRTPLTDWATLTRTWPAFTFTPQNLALAQTHAGRALVVRLLRALSPTTVDEAFGHALTPILDRHSARPLRAALDLLGERALEEALFAVHENDSRAQKAARHDKSDGPAAIAQAAGALAAREFLALRGDAFSELERKAMLQRLAPHAQSTVAKKIEAVWPEPDASTPALTA